MGWGWKKIIKIEKIIKYFFTHALIVASLYVLIQIGLYMSFLFQFFSFNCPDLLIHPLVLCMCGYCSACLNKKGMKIVKICNQMKNGRIWKKNGIFVRQDLPKGNTMIRARSEVRGFIHTLANFYNITWKLRSRGSA